MKRLGLLAAIALVVTACTSPPVSSESPGPSESVAPSASSAPPSSSVKFTAETFPTLDGSTANIPLGSLILQRLVGMPKAQADNVPFTTTPYAYQSLACEPADELGKVVIAYEPAQVTKDTIVGCAKLEYHAIGQDALVFLANDTNPVTSLTTQQYKDIYTGKITNWSAVGGPDQKIVAYERSESSGSQALMRKFVIGTAQMVDTPTDLVTTEMGELIDGVAGYRNTGNAIGYSVFYYAKEMYAQPGVKLLGADGVQPSTATIADGSYPYANDFFAVIRADSPANSPARQVVAWLESAEGQQTVIEAGYVGKKA